MSRYTIRGLRRRLDHLDQLIEERAEREDDSGSDA